MQATQFHISSRGQTSVRLLLRSSRTTSTLATRSSSRAIHSASFRQELEHQPTCPLRTSKDASTTTASTSKLLQRRDRPANHTPYVTSNRRASYSTGTIKRTEPIINSIFEETTGTWQYLVADPSTLSAVIIDPVLDYDPVTQKVSTGTADSLLALASEKGYKVDRILETHAHADHLTAASYLQSQLAQKQGHKPPVGIGKRITQVQHRFGEKYGIGTEECAGVFDKLFDDGETFKVGDLEATAMHLPGHTPDHMGYKIGDNVFCGDSIFHADIGTARCDFPGGSVNDLFNSGRKLLALPDHVKIWTGHDYPPDERETPMAWMSVAEHRKHNKHLHENITEEEFVQLRTARDKILGEPRLLHQSLQINIRGGRLPKPTKLGHSFLHLPLKLNGLHW